MTISLQKQSKKKFFALFLTDLSLVFYYLLPHVFFALSALVLLHKLYMERKASCDQSLQGVLRYIVHFTYRYSVARFAEMLWELAFFLLFVKLSIALWHERDISHSSVERVVAPTACITLDFALHINLWTAA